MAKLTEDLAYEILSVVEEIPVGCVATYGQITRLIGREKNSLLAREGVFLKADGHVDLKKYQWDC